MANEKVQFIVETQLLLQPYATALSTTCFSIFSFGVFG
jgi:hypothetical protein